MGFAWPGWQLRFVSRTGFGITWPSGSFGNRSPSVRGERLGYIPIDLKTIDSIHMKRMFRNRRSMVGAVTLIGRIGFSFVTEGGEFSQTPTRQLFTRFRRQRRLALHEGYVELTRIRHNIGLQ